MDRAGVDRRVRGVWSVADRAGNTHQSNDFHTTGDAGTRARTGAGPDVYCRSAQRRF